MPPTVVLVHGNPETAAIWEPLVAELGLEDVVRLSPPGFGVPLPEDFPATLDAYQDWLVASLERLGRPVHLVGHDLGGLFVVGVAMTRPDLLHSWASDVVGLFEPDYVWHGLAQKWQSAEEGEQHVAAFLGGTPDDKVARLGPLGLSESVVRAMAPLQNADMRRALLGVYRSATQPALAHRGRDLAAAARRPGLHVIATADSAVGSAELRQRASDRAGAVTAILDGLGHWWMQGDPARSAAVLKNFWRLVEGRLL